MPAKNVIKPYIENGFYHLYNRGVEKRNIFLDQQDYKVFFHFLKQYLDPVSKVNKIGLLNTTNISDEVDLICYCLMPNHFHLMVMQRTKNGFTKFLRRILTSYVLYFNNKYSRSGSLFQGKPRGVLVDNETYLLYLSAYIHRNPTGVIPNSKLKSYPYSSYPEYLGLRMTNWLKSEKILQFFNSQTKTPNQNFNSYQSFVENSDMNFPDSFENYSLD